MNAITILFGATSLAESAFGFAIEPIQWTRRVPNLDVRSFLVNVTEENERFIQFEINKSQDEYRSREVASPSSAFDFVGQADHLVDCCFTLVGITSPSLDLAVDVDSIFRLETSGRNNHYAGLCRSNDGAILASDQCPERYSSLSESGTENIPRWTGTVRSTGNTEDISERASVAWITSDHSENDFFTRVLMRKPTAAAGTRISFVENTWIGENHITHLLGASSCAWIGAGLASLTRERANQNNFVVDAFERRQLTSEPSNKHPFLSVATSTDNRTSGTTSSYGW